MIDFDQPDYANHPAAASRVRLNPQPVENEFLPVVSVVTSFFNTGEVFHETAESLFQQSLTQWEWLIVNDKSSDPGSLAVLDRYRDLDPRIRVIDLVDNTGPGGARNEGHRQARADLVFHLDDDDLIEPTTLEKLAWYLATNSHHDLACGWSVAFGGKEYIWLRGFENNNDILESNIVTGRAMMRREAFQAVGGFDESIRGGFEDWELWLRFAANGRWGGCIRETMDWYRRRDDHGDRWETWDGSEKENLFRQSMREKFPELYAQGIPYLKPSFDEGQPFAGISTELPFENPLAKSSMRILMVVPWLAMGGSDKFCLDLLKQLSAKGWQATIVTTLNENLGWMPEFAKVTPDIFPLFSFLPRTDYPRFLDYLIASRQPDVVMITHSELGYTLLPYLRTRNPEPVYVDYNHIEELNWKNGGYPRLGAGLEAMLDLNIVSSEHLRDWMLDRGARPEKVSVCYTNVEVPAELDDESKARTLEEYDIPDNVPVIFFAGRLHQQKQPGVIANVARELVRRGKEFVLVIAGDGPERQYIEAIVSESETASSVRWLGCVPNTEVERLLGVTDIFFLPSLWEGIALSVYEAMAAGVTVVGARVGGQEELVTPDCGVLIEPSTPDEETIEYADRLEELLDNPDEIVAMGARARKRVAKSFSLDSMGSRMAELFDLAAQKHAEAECHSSPKLSESFAKETAVQALELARVTRIADELWGKLHQPAPEPCVAHVEEVHDYAELHASQELDFLDGSGLWKLLRVVGHTAGQNGSGMVVDESISDRLAHIHSSRSYKLYTRIRSNRIYKVYTRIRHGKKV